MDDNIGETIEPFQLHFSDLLLLSSSPPCLSTSPHEFERLESIRTAIMEALGPSGRGLLSVTEVPKAFDLRNTLLPLARKLALHSKEDRCRILKENSLGSDVPLKNPERSVSSFALQLKYVVDTVLEGNVGRFSSKDSCGFGADKEHSNVDNLQGALDLEFSKLKKTFEELGTCMMEVGVRLARICDTIIGGHELEQSILDSCTAKGRLIHYHSVGENIYLKGSRRKKKSISRLASNHNPSHVAWNPEKQNPLGLENGKEAGLMALDAANSKKCHLSNLWQQWHYDYGIFTVLTVPMYMSPLQTYTVTLEDTDDMLCARECCPPDEHTNLQIFDCKRSKIVSVKSPPESFIVQVGESADILSKGMLCSTLHSVSRPLVNDYISRETFVVFLQPAWDKVFSTSGRSKALLRGLECSNDEHFLLGSDGHCISSSDQKSSKLCQEILDVVPPLSSRLKDGMSFAEFSRETTKQYYGGSGKQSKR